MKLWKISGQYLIAIGILHCVFGIAIGIPILQGILKAGIWNTIDRSSEWGEFFWFELAGAGWIVLGKVIMDLIRATGRPMPKYLGWYILIMGILGCILMPASGFWLTLPIGLVMVLAKDKIPSRSTVSAAT